MKVLLDPVYTNNPGHCASNVKFKKLVEHVLSKRKDVFFYWLVPAEGSCWHAEMDWYPQHPNIRYLPYPYNRDRQREYQRLDRIMDDYLSFYGTLWDWDVMVTNRTSLTPNLKAMAIKRGRSNQLWTKQIFLIEDMPIMSFKTKLGSFNFEDQQDMQTLLGYLCADDVVISAFWEKDLILKTAKDYITPAKIRQLGKKITESSAIKFEKTELKTKASIMRMLNGERPFTAGYIGRMVASSRPNEIFQLMQKNWIMHAGTGKEKLRFLASTQSRSNGRINVPPFVEVKSLPREGFWDLCRNEIDVYLFMSKEEDYSMSLVEPLTLGCPAILIRADWSIGTVGPEYPFYVDNFKEAYALLRAFYDDYPRMYAKFAEWSRGHFNALMMARNEVYIGDLFERFLTRWEGEEAKSIENGYYAANAVVQLIAKRAVKPGTEVIVDDQIRQLQEAGELKFLAEKLDFEFRDGVVNGYQTDWYMIKMGLRAHGFRDAGTQTGHFIKGES